jgi:hypothetical protein
MSTDCPQQLTFWDLGPQQVTVDFAGGRVVPDAGFLPLPLLDKQLGVLSTAASGSDSRRAGSGQGGGEYAAAEVVESRSDRQDQRASGLVSLFGELAASPPVCCGLSGGAWFCGAVAWGAGVCLARRICAAAQMSLVRMRQATGRRPRRSPAQNWGKSTSERRVAKFAETTD